VTGFYLCVILYTFVSINSQWAGVFWAAYKNLMVIGCLYIIYQREKIAWVDKFFIGSCMFVNAIQTLMYLLCPLSTADEKCLYFKLFGWFVILIAGSCVVVYIKELWKQP